MIRGAFNISSTFHNLNDRCLKLIEPIPFILFPANNESQYGTLKFEIETMAGGVEENRSCRDYTVITTFPKEQSHLSWPDAVFNSLNQFVLFIDFICMNSDYFKEIRYKKLDLNSKEDAQELFNSLQSFVKDILKKFENYENVLTHLKSSDIYFLQEGDQILTPNSYAYTEFRKNYDKHIQIFSTRLNSFHKILQEIDKAQKNEKERSTKPTTYSPKSTPQSQRKIEGKIKSFMTALMVFIIIFSVVIIVGSIILSLLSL